MTKTLDQQRRLRLVTQVIAALLLAGTLSNAVVAPAHGDELEAAAASSPEVLQEVRRLFALWKARDQAVLTMRIAGKCFDGFGRTPAQAVPRHQLLEMLQKRLIPTAEGQNYSLERLQSVTESLFPPVQGDAAETLACGYWSEFDFLTGAGGVRSKTVVNGQDHIRIRLDGAEQNYHANIKQATLLPESSGIRMEERENFLYWPRIHPSMISPDLRIEDLKNRRRLVLPPYYLLEYDPKTGFIYLENSHGGRQTWFEQVQALPLTLAPGVVVPGISARIEYDIVPERENPTVSVTKMYVIDDAEVNLRVTKEDFKLEIPTGTRVVDMGNRIPVAADKTSRPLITVAPEPVADTLAFGQQAEESFKLRKDRPNRAAAPRNVLGIGMLLLLGNLALLLALGIWLAVRRRGA